jgi:KDO2-lipid IV(A) lauroyltransferase
MKKKRKKGKITKLLEYSAVYIIILFIRVIPLNGVHRISSFLGYLLYVFVPKRRTIALGNLKNAFHGEKTEQEIVQIARQSFSSFFQTFLELVKYQYIYSTPDARDKIKTKAEGLHELFQKAKKIHDQSGGCLFVTPHIGNWEMLPYVSALVGIPLVVVVRALDNEYLESLIYKNSAASGQVIIPKRNAFFVLQETLRRGKSIGMLPDQSTMKGIMVEFLGRKATTTPVPALLSIAYKRPIVVVACCRRDRESFEGFVCDPIWPGEYTSEKAEIYRLTQEMNRTMESIIRKYPDQYLWMHNRWNTYEGKKAFLS